MGYGEPRDGIKKCENLKEFVISGKTSLRVQTTYVFEEIEKIGLMSKLQVDEDYRSRGSYHS